MSTRFVNFFIDFFHVLWQNIFEVIKMSNFSENLRYLRKRADMTQPELAQKLGISRSTICMYELGSREPNFETLEAIADIFNVDMNYLTGNETKNESPLPAIGTELSNAKRIMVEKILQMSDEQAELLDRLADAVLDHKIG